MVSWPDVPGLTPPPMKEVLGFPEKFERQRFVSKWQGRFIYIWLVIFIPIWIFDIAWATYYGEFIKVQWGLSLSVILIPFNIIVMCLFFRSCFFAKRYHIYQALMFLYQRRFGSPIPLKIAEHFFSVGHRERWKFWKKLRDDSEILWGQKT